MATLIVPEVCRYTLNATMGGRNFSNVIDMRINPEAGQNRNDCVLDQADIIWNQWCTDVLPVQVDNYSVVSLDIVDLDSSDGIAGTIAGTGSNPAPQSGDDTGAPFPPGVAVLVRKLLVTGRGRRNGRWYVGGYAENRSSDGQPDRLDAANLAVIQSDFDSFFGNINQDPGVDAPFYVSRLCVVHITARDADGHPTAGDSRDVAQLQVDSIFATQRDRQRS